MRKIKILLILIIGLGACNDRQNNAITDHENASSLEISNIKYNTINLQFNNPMVIDSSDWIIFPLTLEELEETSIGFKSSSYGRQHAYWNIAFSNIETKQTRLLSDSLKMLIHVLSIKSKESISAGQRKIDKKGIIYYSITTQDYNQDGKLNSEDPKYLFISDLSGRGFTQVSPGNFSLLHWQTIQEKNKILIQARKDTNKDKKFNNDDEVVSFVYSLENNKLEQIFSDEFNLEMKKLFNNQWLQNK